MTTNVCSIESCTSDRYCKSFCTKHYQRFKKWGDPEALHEFTGCVNAGGYHEIFKKGRMMLTHRIIASHALGRRLKGSEVVHHVDEDKLNNANNNLVICPGRAYHALLHQRLRAYEATGDANRRKCQFCKAYDMPEKLETPAGRGVAYHKACYNQRQRENRTRRREALCHAGGA